MSLAKRDLLARYVAEPVDLFRIVTGATRGAPGVLESLRSNYERNARPRGLEIESALLHFGLSTFVTLDAAADRATRWPTLGTHIARVRLEPGNGFHVAETAAGHRTVWGRPLQLLACVVDILPVGAS
ncbi:MAG TPA: hypothetical protein VGL78_05780 [Solirubrobacteraceae bacterium]|jgi:hypothetical protein